MNRACETTTQATRDSETTESGETTPSRPRLRSGIALMVSSSISNQVGASFGAMAFPTIGPVGVVAIRQFITAAVLVPLVRPRFRGLGAKRWWLVAGLAVVFSVMNLCLYAAVERIGLGLGVTLEFLGPLAVAIASSRRRLDYACALLAGIGVVVLTNPGPSADVVGISLALIAAAGWACYILLNRSIGQQLPGLEGPALASTVSAVAWVPVAAWWFASHGVTATALALAVACGILSSVVPYVADLSALRYVPTHIFGTFTSVNPVWAALAGWLLLGQMLEVNEWVGIVLIVASNAVVVRGGGAR
ncbi:MAG: EamA family transporter [Ancrocorticia sp.]